MSAKRTPPKKTPRKSSVQTAARRLGQKPAPVNGKGSTAILRKHALKLPETTEAPHFDMPSFRVAGKIFATARLTEAKAMLKLPRELQQAMSAAHPDAIEPVPGTWGERGATFVFIDRVPEKLFDDLVASAWANAAPKKLRDAHAACVRKS